jgi:hypothetical protein
MGRLWQAAGTVKSVFQPGLLEKAADAGLRSLFVGFETVNAAIRRLHSLGIMVNGSFVFGMDSDDSGVFDRTVEWAIEQGIETATCLYQRMAKADRLLHSDWDRYDTRHVVFRPARMTAPELEEGYWHAYREFYRWKSILRGATTKPTLRGKLRHVSYAGGWKKFEPLWDLVIGAKRAGQALPVLEAILSGFGAAGTKSAPGLDGLDAPESRNHAARSA